MTVETSDPQEDPQKDPQAPTPAVKLSRRELIKSIIASGAVVSAGSLLGAESEAV